jgi:hypothetical protein
MGGNLAACFFALLQMPGFGLTFIFPYIIMDVK